MYGSLCLVLVFQHLTPWWFSWQTRFSVRHVLQLRLNRISLCLRRRMSELLTGRLQG